MKATSKKFKTPPFKPNFENGGLWEYYKDLERQFENYLQYVPYLVGNEKTYSYRLADLILSIGAHIDSTFKEIARYPDFEKKYPGILINSKGKQKNTTIWDYYDLSEEYSLPAKRVWFKRLPERQEIHPFRDYQKKIDKKGKEVIVCPNWWNVYNGVKHKFKDNFGKATLRVARNALAGAFLLNVVHIPGALRLCEYGLVTNSVGNRVRPCSSFEHNLIAKMKPNKHVETSVFAYDYNQ